jgi:flagellar motor switch protein FliN
MKTYLDCWVDRAAALFSQTLAGQPELVESLPEPPEPLGANSFGFAASVFGDHQGRFAVILDGAILESPLLGEGADQKAAWGELLREVADAACTELLARTGKKCLVESFEPIAGESNISRAFRLKSEELKSEEQGWQIVVQDEVRDKQQDQVRNEPLTAKSAAKPAASQPPASPQPPPPVAGRESAVSPGTVWSSGTAMSPGTALSPGIELLLDVELEVSLRFGSREMPLGELLDLGPGDVVQLDRHVTDPVDLIVSDKIVARGEVVLVNGNFGLRVTEVAAPKKRLETIRCLF